jgi:hypothetical protein
MDIFDMKPSGPETTPEPRARDETTPTRCEAHTGRRYTDWGWEPVTCHQWKGLRTFFDGNGREHAFCAALGHLHDVVRRFGAMAHGDAITAAMTEGERREAWGK